MSTGRPAVERLTWRPPLTVGALPIAMVVTAIGVGFNLLRLVMRLDHGPLVASMLAFALLGCAAAVSAWALGLDGHALGLRRSIAGRGLIGGALSASVLVGAALATAPVTRLPSAGQVLGGIALFGLCTAPAEELLFRGVLYAAVARELGPLAAVVVSSVAFAAAHVPVYGLGSLPVAICAGLVLGWLRWWSSSLAAPTAVHAVADLALLWL